MLFVHIYLSAFHPLMRHAGGGDWESMSKGAVAADYAASHHGKWYRTLARTPEGDTE